jgi:hypothetical protein
MSIVDVGPPRPVDERYVDLQPGEDLLTSSYSLTNLNSGVNGIRERADRSPVQIFTELVVHLDEIGALA